MTCGTVLNYVVLRRAKSFPHGYGGKGADKTIDRCATPDKLCVKLPQVGGISVSVNETYLR